MTTSAKRSGLLGAGIVVLIVGVLTAIGLWYSAGQRQTDAVRGLARAPIGCDTTLDFESTGDFLIFVETAGTLGDDVAGDCAAGGDFEWTEAALPPVTLALTSPDGNDVALGSQSGVTYDVDNSAGQSVRTFTIDEPGDYVLRVESPDGEAGFAMAVGRDPSDGVSAMRLGALLAGVAGLALGGVLLLVARRGKSVEATPIVNSPWPSEPTGWPTAPPGLPTPPPPSGWQPAVGPPTHMPGYMPTHMPVPPAMQQPTPEGDGRRSPWAPPSDAPQ